MSKKETNCYDGELSKRHNCYECEMSEDDELFVVKVEHVECLKYEELLRRQNV